MVVEVKPATKALICWRCKKLLAEKITPPYEITCPRCHASNCEDVTTKA